MPTRRAAAIVFALALATALTLAAAPRGGQDELDPPLDVARAARPADVDASPAAPDELIVRFRPGTDAPTRSDARAAIGAKRKEGLPLRGLELLDLPAGASPRAAAARLAREPAVDYAEPNWTRHASGSVSDPLFPYEWGIHNTGQTINGTAGTADADIDAPEAWDVSSGDPRVTVAVVDTGVDTTHPDLRSQLWTNPGESGSGRDTNGLDDDADGFVDDVHGWNFVGDNGDPTDDNGHGTHVSGTIAAASGDDRGVAGVAHRSTVMPLRVLNANGSGTVADVVSGYRFAAAHGVRVVNASLGSDTFSRAERDALAASPDTLFVVAAGNGGADGVGDDVDQEPEYPCAYDLANVVCVAATDSSDRLASFSNHGAVSVDVAAPGTDILSAWPRALGGSYAWSDGTSMATPHVAATAALVAARIPSATTDQLRTAVLDGADTPPSLSGEIAGARRLNAFGALVDPGPAPAPPPNTAPATTPDATPAPTDTAPTLTAPTPDTAGAPQPAPAPVAPDTTPPVVTLAAPRRVTTRGLARGDVRIGITCSEPCRITAVLARPRAARTSRLLVARAGAQLRAAGLTRLRIRPPSRLTTALRRMRPLARLRLELAVRDPAGNRRRVVKSLRLVR